MFISDEEANRQAEIIKDLRKEAYDVRDCFARFAFQALLGACTLLAAIITFELERSHIGVGMLALIPAILLLSVLTMGLHKYGTSNRLLGQELHLSRTRFYLRHDEWHQKMWEIGWEEAMRAWRVIQPTIFRALYHPKFSFGPDWARRRLSPIVVRIQTAAPLVSVTREGSQYPGRWYLPKQTIQAAANGAADYNAGGYFKALILVFYALILACMSFAWFSWFSSSHVYLYLLVISVATLVLVLRCWHVVTRIKILEDEILSIHACGIVWEATVLAHFLAIKSRQSDSNPASLHGYTAELARIATEIAKNAEELHKWIDETRPRVVEFVPTL